MAKPITLDEYVKITEWAFSGLLAKSVMGELIVLFPFLGTPGLEQLLEQGVSYVINRGCEKAEVAAFFKYTDFRVSAEGRTFQGAVEKHAALLKTGSEVEKANSQKELLEAFRNFITVTN